MGIDTHALNAVRLVAQCYGLGDMLTIGRQELSIDPSDRARYGIGPDIHYAEPLFEALGARSVASLDVSDYEGASYVADLGRSINLGRRFDTVLDAGSIEHVFDQHTAFTNVRSLVGPGGVVCHLLPVNNLAGHGLWQYASDLLYTIYAPENGWAACQLFYTSGLDPRWWYRVPPPRPGSRVNLASVEPVIAITIVTRAPSGADEPLVVQQPFYATAWNDPASIASLRDRAPSRLWAAARLLRRAAPGAYILGRNLRHLSLLAAGRSPLGLSASNAGMRRVAVRDLVEAGTESLLS